jgi:hypothetical protein
MTSTKEDTNILLRDKGPAKRAEEFYLFEKKKKDAFTVIKGT